MDRTYLSNTYDILEEIGHPNSDVSLAIRIFWTFDGNLNDLYNNYPGVGINSPSYVSPGITGYGACLYLNSNSAQSATIASPPFLNMAYTSFSLTAWVFANTLSVANATFQGDNAVFGQHHNYTQGHSLHIIVRNQRIYLGFFADDIQGNFVLSPNVWYHVSCSSIRSTVHVYILDGLRL